MADYQSLLNRAVDNLPNASVAAARQAIYDRARTALVTQLRSLRPPLPDSDIEREERALEKAIAQVEQRFSSTDATREAPSEADSASPQQSAANRAVGPPPAWKPTESKAPAAPPPVPPASAGAGAQTQPRPTAAVRPPAPPKPPPPLSTARAAVRPAAPSASSGEAAFPRGSPSGARSTPVQVAPLPDARANARAAPPVILTRADGETSARADFAKPVPNVRVDPAEGLGAPPVLASFVEDSEPPAVAPAATVDVESGESPPKLESEMQRPFAPTAEAEKRRSWPWLALAAVLGIVLSIAAAAILMRQKPQDLAIAPPPEPQQEAPQRPAKIAERAEPARAEAASPASSVPAEGGPQGGQGTQTEPAASPPETQNSAQLPPTGRAAMLIASADNPQKPVVNLGSTVWSTIPASPGQPASVGVKAEADIPDLKMHATMILRKNTDPTLEATHTIDLKFTFADAAPITGFKEVGLPQMRKLDSTTSEQLNSAKVKISDDYFLIALAKSDQDLAHNLDLMKMDAWFDFPLLLNDDRIAKLVFQKSEDGEAMLEKAFDTWK
ncbi:MAG TPA: hypothetical protein VFE63_13630 [Roseiarcus sp.]|jgi:hypothetical protein|nr:hypothetical protein [Roseiarcus sp.]